MKAIVLILAACSGVFAFESDYSVGRRAVTASPDLQRSLKDVSNTLVITPKDDIVTAYNWLKSADRDVQMGAVSGTNPRTLLLSPGVYILTASPYYLTMTPYVYIAGTGNACIIKSTQVPDASHGAIYIVPNTVADNNSVAYYLKNLSIWGQPSSGNYASGIGFNTGLKRTRVVIENCYVYGASDILYTGKPGGGAFYYTIDIYNSRMQGAWDGLTLGGTGLTCNVYGGSVKIIDDANQKLFTGYNPPAANMISNVLIASAGTINCYGVELYQYINKTYDPTITSQTDIGVATTFATSSVNPRINLYGCSVSSTVILSSGSVTTSGAIYSKAATGIINLIGCSITNSGPVAIRATAGTVNVSPDTTFDHTSTSVTSGTISYSGTSPNFFSINADPAANGVGGLTGTGTTPAGTVGVYINGVRYWLLTSATQN
jgi:hypothetical protein